MVALYPFCFIEMDGYHVLVDVLGIPTLKSRCARVRGGAPDRRGPGAAGSASRLSWLGYVVLSTLSVAAFIVFNVRIIFTPS